MSVILDADLLYPDPWSPSMILTNDPWSWMKNCCFTNISADLFGSNIAKLDHVYLVPFFSWVVWRLLLEFWQLFISSPTNIKSIMFSVKSSKKGVLIHLKYLDPDNNLKMSFWQHTAEIEAFIWIPSLIVIKDHDPLSWIDFLDPFLLTEQLSVYHMM